MPAANKSICKSLADGRSIGCKSLLYCTLSGRNPTRQIQLTCTFNYLFGISSGLDKQQFQAFANTLTLPATIKNNQGNY